ncbi:AAA family ATPase [Corallococcus sp. Z5C101001]|uniref:AAA family ATPase n=1 Tax=Corallococcus sp. Z5C101001 TaxID=2596829 RepID=UPI00117E4097|nr:AAA family ATPase [Corallococcus sp. Z5C101001]TSC32770.1 ATP-binding protein [Corallococcus sp. Z5C101001]
MSAGPEGAQVTVLCGWPLSGKSETAARVGRELGAHVVDVDVLARAGLGLPEEDWWTTDAGRRRNLNRMAMAYELLHQAVRIHLEVAEPKRSLVVVSTYSRPSSWRFLQAVMAPHPEVRFKVLWLRPADDSPEAVRELLGRRAGAGYCGGCTTPAEYFDVKARFVPPPLPHRVVDTWFRHTPEACAQRALDYVLAP